MTMIMDQMAPPGQGKPGLAARVIVGIDNTPAGLAALRWAVRLARSCDAPLVAVRAWGG